MSNNGGATKRKAPEEEAAECGNHIALSIKGQDGRELFFKVNRDTQFGKVFRHFCERMNLEYQNMQFLYNGHRVFAKQTPKKLKMEDNDEILAARHLLGGGVAELSLYQHDMTW